VEISPKKLVAIVFMTVVLELNKLSCRRIRYCILVEITIESFLISLKDVLQEAYPMASSQLN
jgi:hypothetical protein